MTRHIYLLMVVIWGTLIISDHQASPDPQFSSIYYQPAFSSYFQPVSNQQLSPSSYYHQPLPAYIQQLSGPQFGPNHPSGEKYHEFSPITRNEEDKDPNSRLLFWALACPGPIILNPCNCYRTRIPWWSIPTGNIVCPALTAAEVKSIFSLIPAWKNIATVTLNLPRGANIANSLPASFTTNYPQTAISIVISPNDGSCIDSTLLSPCTCAGSTITCPAGNSIAQIQAVFNNIAQNIALGNVIINLPAGVNSIPANFLGGNAANSITLIATVADALSQLTINANAFTSSAATATAITIQEFDNGQLDYSFLNGFNVLITLNLNNCGNNPTAANQPKNLPNLPKLVSILVNGVPYKKQCPSAAYLAPCTCDGTGVQVKITCPAGTEIDQIQGVFNKLPANSYLGDVVLYFPALSTTPIPKSLLGNNTAYTIEVVGPTSGTSSGVASVLDIDAEAFLESANSLIQFTVTSYDVAYVDYSFLSNFNALENVNINKCTNSPTALNQLRNFPPKLPKFKAIAVDGKPLTV